MMRHRRVIVVAVGLLALALGCGEAVSPGVDTTTEPPTSTSTTPIDSTTSSTTTPQASTSTTTTLGSTTTAAPPETEPPVLVVSDPVTGAAVTTRVHRFSGHTDPGVSLVAAGRYPVAVGADGSWAIDLVLNPGGNVASFAATDRGGNTTTVRVPVYRVEPTGLVGETAETRWTVAGFIQAFYVNGEPTGYTSGARLSLAGPGGSTGFRLGFALRSELGRQRGPFDRDLEGAFLLMEWVGETAYVERYRVLDEIPFSIPAGTGTPGVTAQSFGIGDMAVRIAFTPDGPVVREAWEPDLLRGAFVPVDPSRIPWTTGPVGVEPGTNGAGAVVTVGGSHDPYAPDAGRILDISGETPSRLDLEELGGSLIFDDETSSFAVALVGAPDADGWPEARTVWLEQMLAWDYGGCPLWWVRSELVMSPDAGLPDLVCWTNDSDRLPAVALEDPAVEERVIDAWLVDATFLRFVPIDPSMVMCESVGD